MNSTRRMILMITVFFMFIPVLSLADNEIDLPATGQATCYDESGNVMSCTVTDSEGQDAEVMAGFDWLGWDTSNNRFTNNLDGTVTDRLTGLMWLQNGNCISIEYPSFDNDNTVGDGKVTRQHGLDFIKGINDGTYPNCDAGYTDWRLPNVNELESLVHAEKADTSAWLNSQPFMNVQGEFYWSSTWRDGGIDVLIVGMETGGLIPDSGVNDNHVLSVRAGQLGSPDPSYPANIWKTGQTTCFDDGNTTPVSCAGTGQDGETQAGIDWPATRFTDNFDGTMNDNLPELMWLEDANCINTQYPSFDTDDFAGDGMVTWQHALDFVKGINEGTYSNCGGGYTDWRLPNRKELRSLYNYAIPLPGGVLLHSTWLMNEGFSNVEPDNYWTSTTITAFTDKAWRIALADKEVADSPKKTFYHYAWPVRDGLLNADIRVTDSTPPVDDHLVHLGDVLRGNFSDRKVTITNDGNANLNISDIGNNNPLAEPFSILFDNCRGQSLLPSKSCDFTIRFAPPSGSHFNDSFDIVHNDTNESPVIVSVRGNAIINGGIIELPRTGRVWSYYPFDDGYFMAGAAWPSPRFADNGDGTLTDKLTGLMWTKNADLPPGAKTWQEALNFAAGLSTGCCDDWRLPNVVELESLIHADVADTAAWLNNQGFQNVQAGDYWSSTTDMLFTNEARSVNMSTGSVYRGSKELSNFYVWAVRAGQTGSPDPAYPANIWQTGQTDCYDQAGSAISCTGTGQDGDIQAGVAWPSPRFRDRGETQADELTGLIWATDANLPGGAGMGFWDALAYIQGMNAGTYENFGYVSWRLPNRKELLSLADFSQDSPVLPPGHEFTNVQSDFYWSSTVSSSTPDAAWTIFMDEGFMLNNYFSGAYRVWPVLGGSFACVISTTPNAMVESNQTDAELGYSVSGAGDVNGDGFDDVIAGAVLYDNGEVNEGAAFVYHGSASGISTTPAVILESNKTSGYMGSSLSGAGDVNGDGYDDIIVGVSNYDNGESHEGAAFVYLGGASGISPTSLVILESNVPNAYLGISVSGAGDVNDDGYEDVIVGASNYSNGQPYEGAAYVYHGSASGISTTPDVILESNQINAFMGQSVSGAGDINADGFDDVIVGAHMYDNSEVNEGVVFVYHGSALGISASPAAILESNQADAHLGSSLSGAEDVNNDGFDDIIVAVYNYTDPSAGKAHVYHGSASGISTTPAVILVSNVSNSIWGIANSVSGADDVNADGFDDIIIGAKDYLDGYYSGAAFVYLGGASGISEYPGAKVQSDQSAELGFSVSGTGDVNGDGFADVIVGARNYDNGEEDEGAAFIYHGKGCRTQELCLPPFHDSDWDRICDDGDLSGTPGDNPCTGGSTFFCDDNCPDDVNTGQADADGDGIGDACEGGADNDGDGIPDLEEQGPDGSDINYDGNDDGTPDSEQDNVASFHTHDGENYVTLALPDVGTTLSTVQAVENPSPDDAPEGVEFPLGFFEFTIEGVGMGGATTATLHIPPEITIDTYYKHGPSPDPTPDAPWYEFLYDDGETGAEINNIDHEIHLHFVDAKRGDNILIQDAMIVEPGGPGIIIVCSCDVSGDGMITPQDALCAFQKYLGICPTSCGPCDEICGDINGDGNTTPADALCVFQEYLGIGCEHCN